MLRNSLKRRWREFKSNKWLFFYLFLDVKHRNLNVSHMFILWHQRSVYLYDISGGCSWCTFHTGLGHCRVHGCRRELLLVLVHARVGNLGSMRALDHGLRGARRHHLGLRVSAQRSHDGSSDGGRRGVVVWHLLNNCKPGVKICLCQL